jgi:16S rRNA (uracil1498-N3)-methyltransferase
MSEHASGAPRLYVAQSLTKDDEFSLSRPQTHYLIDVLRLKPGDPVRAFNGEDGEWLCYLTAASKKAASLRCERPLAAVRPPPDIDYVFAPLKHSRLDYAVQKATELGARRLRPVWTQRTTVSRINAERMRANVIEAAEQCNLVYIPEVCEARPLSELLLKWEPVRTAIFCDERAAIANPLKALQGVGLPAAVIVGPEGGFTDEERANLLALPSTRAISLGPRIMRADTAAVAALAIAQAVLGDWRA